MTQRKNRTWIQILTFINEDSNQPAFILYINWTQIIYGKKSNKNTYNENKHGYIN